MSRAYRDEGPPYGYGDRRSYHHEEAPVQNLEPYVKEFPLVDQYLNQTQHHHQPAPHPIRHPYPEPQNMYVSSPAPMPQPINTTYYTPTSAQPQYPIESSISYGYHPGRYTPPQPVAEIVNPTAPAPHFFAGALQNPAQLEFNGMHCAECLEPLACFQPFASLDSTPSLSSDSSNAYLPENLSEYLHSQSTQLAKENECPICYRHYDHSQLCGCNDDCETPVQLPNCGHIYGLDCLKIWLTYRRSCPICSASTAFINNSHLIRNFYLGYDGPPRGQVRYTTDRRIPRETRYFDGGRRPSVAQTIVEPGGARRSNHSRAQSQHRARNESIYGRDPRTSAPIITQVPQPRQRRPSVADVAYAPPSPETPPPRRRMSIHQSQPIIQPSQPPLEHRISGSSGPTYRRESYAPVQTVRVIEGAGMPRRDRGRSFSNKAYNIYPDPRSSGTSQTIYGQDSRKSAPSVGGPDPFQYQIKPEVMERPERVEKPEKSKVVIHQRARSRPPSPEPEGPVRRHRIHDSSSRRASPEDQYRTGRHDRRSPPPESSFRDKSRRRMSRSRPRAPVASIDYKPESRPSSRPPSRAEVRPGTSGGSSDSRSDRYDTRLDRQDRLERYEPDPRTTTTRVESRPDRYESQTRPSRRDSKVERYEPEVRHERHESRPSLHDPEPRPKVERYEPEPRSSRHEPRADRYDPRPTKAEEQRLPPRPEPRPLSRADIKDLQPTVEDVPDDPEDESEIPHQPSDTQSETSSTKPSKKREKVQTPVSILKKDKERTPEPILRPVKDRSTPEPKLSPRHDDSTTTTNTTPSRKERAGVQPGQTFIRPDLQCSMAALTLCAYDDPTDDHGHNKLFRLDCGHGYHVECLKSAIAAKERMSTSRINLDATEKLWCERCRNYFGKKAGV